MFVLNQDYNIIDAKVPVLMRQPNGQFEFKDCCFLEFTVGADEETMKKIIMACRPFNFTAAVELAISKNRFSENKERLFFLVGPDTVKNDFKNRDDFLALALCSDGVQKTQVQYFEVNYNFRHSYEPNQKYRRVGTSALNALKKVYHARELYGESALEAVKFWAKNGFTRIGESKQDLHWRQR